MEVTSIGLRTDLMLIAWDGVVDEIDGVIRARTPSNPNFYFGNFVLFPGAPGRGDAVAWTARFGTAFRDDPRVHHVCLRWDCTDGRRGDLSELEQSGFTIEETVVLTTSKPRPPPRIDADATLRRIVSNADWAAVADLQAATMTEQYGAGGGVFARSQVARFRHFVDAGRGAWFGAFHGDALAADMGVFVEAGLGRFQAVETAAFARRRGLCGTLAYHAAQAALLELGAKTLVMVGLPDHTAQIYASVGFTPCERLVAAYRGPPTH